MKILKFSLFSVSYTDRKYSKNKQFRSPAAMKAKVVLVSSSAKINLFPSSGVPGKVAAMTDIKIIFAYNYVMTILFLS